MYGKLITGGIVAVAIFAAGSCSLERVTSGHVGVRVNNMGSHAGVQTQPLQVGWYFTPPGVSVYEYPVYTNTKVFKEDDAFRFQDKNGMSLSGDVSVAYHADPTKAPLLFQKYRTDIDGIMNGPVRTTLRNAVVTEASMLTVDRIYGDQKAALIERARQRAARVLEPIGLHIDQLFWDSNINLPEGVQKQIAARVENEQAAIAAQARVGQFEAVANQRRAEAQGIADAALIKAKADAEATRITGEALRSNPESIEKLLIEKWQGGVPQIVGSNSQVPFIGPKIGR